MRTLPAIAALLGFAMFASPAQASSHTGIYTELSAETGLDIQPMGHNELVPYSENESAIVAAAKRLGADDPVIKQLLDYHAPQSAACAGAAITEEALTQDTNPYHRCLHAEYAAVKGMLMQLNHTHAADPQVATLSLNLLTIAPAMCLDSETSFNTSDIVRPDVPSPAASNMANGTTGQYLAIGVLSLLATVLGATAVFLSPRFRRLTTA